MQTSTDQTVGRMSLMNGVNECPPPHPASPLTILGENLIESNAGDPIGPYVLFGKRVGELEKRSENRGENEGVNLINVNI